MKLLELEVEDQKWPEYKRHFLRIHPNQTLDADNPLSDEDWIRFRIFLFARGAYEKGFTQEHNDLDGPVFDTNIITLS